jgi:hypothetical protein
MRSSNFSTGWRGVFEDLYQKFEELSTFERSPRCLYLLKKKVLVEL